MPVRNVIDIRALSIMRQQIKYFIFNYKDLQECYVSYDIFPINNVSTQGYSV